jgi:hypothetical protein
MFPRLFEVKQDLLFTNNVTLRRVRITTFAVQKQEVVQSVSL